MRALLVIGVLFLLVGCAGSPFTRTTVATAIACDGYAEVLEQLTPHKAKLTPAQVERVNQTNALVDPFCLPGGTGTDGLAVVQQAIQLITSMKESVNADQ